MNDNSKGSKLVTEVLVYPDASHPFNEGTIRAKLEGPLNDLFVELTAQYTDENVTVCVTPQIWPRLKEVIDAMLADSVELGTQTLIRDRDDA